MVFATVGREAVAAQHDPGRLESRLDAKSTNKLHSNPGRFHQNALACSPVYPIWGSRLWALPGTGTKISRKH